MTVVRSSANGHRAEPPRRPVDWSAVGYRPAEGTPTKRCACGGAYLDDEPEPGRSRRRVRPLAPARRARHDPEETRHDDRRPARARPPGPRRHAGRPRASPAPQLLGDDPAAHAAAAAGSCPACTALAGISFGITLGSIDRRRPGVRVRAGPRRDARRGRRRRGRATRRAQLTGGARRAYDCLNVAHVALGRWHADPIQLPDAGPAAPAAPSADPARTPSPALPVKGPSHAPESRRNPAALVDRVPGPCRRDRVRDRRRVAVRPVANPPADEPLVGLVPATRPRRPGMASRTRPVIPALNADQSEYEVAVTKLAGTILISRESIDDTDFPITQQAEQILSDTFSAKLDRDFIGGTGVAPIPQGIVGVAAEVTGADWLAATVKAKAEIATAGGTRPTSRYRPAVIGELEDDRDAAGHQLYPDAATVFGGARNRLAPRPRPCPSSTTRRGCGSRSAAISSPTSPTRHPRRGTATRPRYGSSAGSPSPPRSRAARSASSRSTPSRRPRRRTVRDGASTAAVAPPRSAARPASRRGRAVALAGLGPLAVEVEPAPVLAGLAEPAAVTVVPARGHRGRRAPAGDPGRGPPAGVRARDPRPAALASWAPPLDPPTPGGLAAADAEAIALAWWHDDPHLAAALMWEPYAATLPPAPAVSRSLPAPNR